MRSTSRNELTGWILAWVVGAGVFAGAGVVPPTPVFAPSIADDAAGHPCPIALPAFQPCFLGPVVDEPMPQRPGLTEADTSVRDQCERRPRAARAPPRNT